MPRGDVWVVDMDLPDPKNLKSTIKKKKYAVELQDTTHLRDVAVVLASTDRVNRPPKAWEVAVDESDGFDHETLIDGRWVWTISRARLEGTIHITTLSPRRMEEVSEAIVVGLQLV